MTNERDLAIDRLMLSNKISLHRHKDLYVRVVDEEGETVAIFPKEDWNVITDFFVEISHPKALL